MKLDEINKTTSDVLFESASEMAQLERESDKMEEAWEQLAYLHEALETGDFGILIGKPNSKLTHHDIMLIKREIAGIIADNAVLDGQDIQNRRDGLERIRVLGRSIQAGLEASALGTIAVGLTALGGITGPVGAALSAVGAIGSVTLAKTQLDMLSSLRSTARLLDIVDSFKALNPKKRKRGLIRRFFDKLLMKTPAQIRKEVEMDTKRAAQKARRDFEKAIKDLPRNIEYIDNNGKKRYYPIEELFNV